MVKEKIVTKNRQALHNFEIIESYEAGIELKGPEVKSIRAGRVNLKDGFATIDDGELFLSNCHISPYEHTSVYTVDPVRRRKLLMRKSQIMRLKGLTSQKGHTLIPLKLYFKQGLCKIELALAKGKKLYDKRQSIKEKDARRELKQAKEHTKRKKR